LSHPCMAGLGDVEPPALEEDEPCAGVGLADAVGPPGRHERGDHGSHSHRQALQKKLFFATCSSPRVRSLYTWLTVGRVQVAT
jgi:hypothetical protein